MLLLFVDTTWEPVDPETGVWTPVAAASGVWTVVEE